MLGAVLRGEHESVERARAHQLRRRHVSRIVARLAAPAAAASSCLCARAGRQRPADSMGGRRWPPPTAPSSSAARRQSCRDGVAYHSLNLDPAHALPLVGERKQVTRGALYKRGHALPVNGIAVDHRRTHHVRALKAGRRPERGHAGNCLRKGGECHAVESMQPRRQHRVHLLDRRGDERIAIDVEL